MNQSFWLAFAAYVLVTYALTYLWHNTTFAPRYEELGLYRDDVVYPLGEGSWLIQGLLFAWVYPHVFSTADDQWLFSGLKFAAAFGVLALSFLVLPTAGKGKVTSVSNYLMLETAFTAIQFVITGLLIAFFYRGFNPV